MAPDEEPPQIRSFAMKIERTKNTIKNIKVGMFLRVYQMLVPFLMRTVMLYFMGVQYLGLNSLFTSVLQVLNLAELGVGSAMVFAMYKPIAHDDTQTICALMRLYRKYYRIIGAVVGAVGLALTPAIPYLISGDIPGELNIYVLYLLNLGTTVLTYWLFAYRNCLLQAHQRTDAASLVTAGTYTLQCVIQIVVLLVFKNYYLYVITALLTQVINNVVTAVVTTKMYPLYRPIGTLDEVSTKAINQRIRDIFTGKLGAVVLKSSDTLVISGFLGLTVLAIYHNYFFIVSSILGIVEIILSSMTAGLGNSYVLETKEKNYQDLKKFTFLFMWLTGVCTCCFLGMYQPFMEIWTGEELMLEFGAVICFAAYFLVYTLNRLLSVYKDAAGLWHEDRFRPLITALANLLLNLLLVKEWGIYGVLLSTVLSMVLIGMPWIIQNLFSGFFERSMMRGYVGQLLVQVFLTIVSGVLTCLACTQVKVDVWLELCICAVISCLIPNLIFWVFFRKSAIFKQGVRFLDHLTGEKLKLECRLCSMNDSDA